MSQTYYDILGISKEANEQEIKRAYRSLALKYHPDRNSDPEANETFKHINTAYETLSDLQKKNMYDNNLNNPFANMNGDGGMSSPFGGMGGGFDDIGNIQNMFHMMFSGGMQPGVNIFHQGGNLGRNGNPATMFFANKCKNHHQ